MYTLGFLLLGLVYVVYERLILSPLSRVPGPPLAAATRLVLIYYEFTRRRTRWIHEQHLRYGPVVRIAPDEVSFASWSAVKEIYASEGSGYEKTSFYKLFDNYNGTECMFSTLDRAPHAQRKKRIADRYSKSFIMQPEVVSGIQERGQQFVSKCTERAGQAVDVYIYLHCYALDCITYHLFDPFGTKSLMDAPDLLKVKDLLFHDNLKDSLMQHYFRNIPRFTDYFVGRRDRARKIASQLMNMARRSDISEHSVSYKLQTYTDQLDTRSIASELMDHTLAGIDTTGDGLTFLMYHLSLPSSSAIQDKMHRELVDNPDMPIDDLPYLDAVVKEGLRCFPPIPMSLPRKAPRGGATIEGYFIPEDAIVSSQAMTVHQLDTKVFPSPEEFIPERWLDSEGSLDRNQLFLAFSTGGRGCIGKHLALLEMKMLLKEVYSTCRTKVANEMTVSMEPDDQIITTRPKGQSCLLTFEIVV